MLFAIAQSQDTAGPMARTVEDAVLLLSILVERDERDPVTLKSEATYIETREPISIFLEKRESTLLFRNTTSM